MALARLRRPLIPIAGVLALVLAFTGLTMATAPAATAAPAPAFDCTEPRFFAQAGNATSTQLYTGSYNSQGNSVWTALGSSKSGSELYNALAFNPVDEYLYGTRFSSGAGNFVRINRSGEITQLGDSAPALGSAYNTLWDSGEFDAAGNYYVASGNAGFTGSNSPARIRKVSGLSAATSASSTPRPVLESVTLTPAPRIADFAFKDDFLWAPNYGVSSTIYRIDINNVLGNGAGAVTSFTVDNTVLPVNSYGSAFRMTNDNLAFIGTDGYMYQVSVTNPAAATPEFELVNRVAAPTNSYSDATNCATAQEASLSVEKTGPATIGVGETITWNVAVTNDGPGITSGFVLTDLLPMNLDDIQVESTDTACVLNAAETVVTCNGGRLAVGQTATMEISATAPSTPGPIQNQASVVGNEDPDPDAPATADTDVVISTQAGAPVTLTDPGATVFDSSSIEGGTVTYVGGVFTYTPLPGYSGRDSFTYTTAGGTVTVYIVVSPLAVGAATTTSANTPGSYSGQALVDAGTGTGLELTSVGNPVNGTVSIVDGDPVFVPAPGFSGTGSFDFTLTDDDGGTVTATVTVAVTPTAGPGTAATSTNQSATIPFATLVNLGVGTGLELTSVGGVVNGTGVSIAGGNVVFEPTPDFSGVASFTYTVTDDDGQTATGIVTVTVAPTAANDSRSTPAETSVSIDVLDNDNGTDLTITSVSTPSSGTAVIAAGEILYTPADDFSGIATFTYVTTDGQGATATATVTVTVTPDAADGVTTTGAEEPVTILASELVTAGTGTGLTVTSVSNPTNGTVSIVAGNPQFVPADGFSGTATFDYTMTDASTPGLTATATITVTVTPVATADTVSTTAGTAITIDALDNDLGTSLSITGIASIVGGTAVENGGEIDFTPTPGFSGTASFTYEVTDGANQTTTTTVAITVTPVAVNDDAETDSGTAVSVDVLDNDRGTGLTITAISTPTVGTAVLDNGEILFTPPTGFSGDVTFTYDVADASTQTTTASVTVTVNPTVENETATTTTGTAVTVPTATLVGAGTGTGLELTVVGGAVNGAVTLVAGGAQFTPAPGFSGDASFTFTLTDDDGGTVTGTVDVTVSPTATAETATTSAGTPVTVTATTLEGAGSGTGLELTAVGAPVNGTVALVLGDAEFTPAPGFSGTGSFEFTLTDDDGGTVTQTVTVTIAPVANGDTVTTPIDTSVTMNVITNDAGVGLGVSNHGAAGNGTAAIAADGTLVYTPNTGFSGVDTVTYTLTGDGGTDTATVNILVTPLAPDDLGVTDANQPVNLDVLVNDAGTGLFITGTTTPTAGGTVTFSATSVDYVPATNFSGIDTFTYTVEDAAGSIATATVTVNVLPVTSPSATRGAAGEEITIDVSGSGTGSGLVVTSVNPPINGTAVINPDGTITFVPRDGFSGVEVIEYTVTDADGLTAVGTVRITVMPTAVADEGRTVAGDPVTITPLANDLGAGLTVISTTAPSNGSAVVNQDGSITYTPAAGFSGTDTFTYTVEDAAGNAVAATVTIIVTPALPFMGVEPGAIMLLALALLGLGGLSIAVRRVRVRPRHRAA